MNLIFFDDQDRENLLPLVFTRPVSEIRIGILTIREKWEKLLGQNDSSSFFTQEYLKAKYPLKINDENIFINGGIIPDQTIIEELKTLKNKEALYSGTDLIAVNLGKEDAANFSSLAGYTAKSTASEKVIKIKNPWEIFGWNDHALRRDYELITRGRKSASISSTNTLIGHDIFVEEGATVEASILNSKTGPIYIGKDSEVMEGSVIRGPFSLGEHSATKLSTKIYGATTIGPHSKVGGELNNVVIFGYSNKAHDGFLGNAVIGEWCNLGADTNNSNLKNNYAEVKLWSYAKNRFVKTGLQFCGLIMGDHSKCGINTMFNTGTLVGVSCNIFGAGFPRNFIPSFAWGGAQGFETYQIDKVFETTEVVFKRRGLELNEIEKDILRYLFEQSKTERYWDKTQN